MDAVKFIKEKVRMCNSIMNGCTCTGCPLREYEGCDPDDLVEHGNVENAVRFVEEWSAAHPRKTRQSVFLEQWPEARVDARGVLDIEPCLLLKRYSYKAEDGCDDVDGDCIVCRREFWMQEVE